MKPIADASRDCCSAQPCIKGCAPNPGLAQKSHLDPQAILRVADRPNPSCCLPSTNEDDMHASQVLILLKVSFWI